MPVLSALEALSSYLPFTQNSVWHLYCRPYDEQEPLVCLDEMGKNLVKEKHPSEPAKPGQDRREDYTSEKKGQRNLFIACEPLGGKRSLKVTQRRTKKDWAYFIEELLTVHYPTARKVILVMDNLNTHTPASLYDTFPPEKAKGLLDRLEIHYTPKHASWLNMAEIKLSVLARQGLEYNIATVDELCEQVQSWQAYRNQQMATVHWRFTTADARIKLQRLYPTFQERSRKQVPASDNSRLVN
jgi:hypothetical protein